MKAKKLEKKTAFTFKKNNITNLSKEQARKINGGNGQTDGGGPSGFPGCIENKTILATVG